MSSLRPLLAAVAAAFAVAPAPASAALTPAPPFTGAPLPHSGTWTADGVLSPGETVGLDFPLVDSDGSYAATHPSGTSNGSLSINNAASGGFADGYVKPFPVNSPVQGTTMNSSPFNFQFSPTAVCGAPVGMDLTVDSTQLHYAVPTGAAGAFRRFTSHDTGTIVTTESSKTSVVTVPVSASGEKRNDIAKALRIHIDQLTHSISTYFVKLELVSPSGTKILLMKESGRDLNYPNPTAELKNVTFSDSATTSLDDMNADPNSTYVNKELRPIEPFSKFDGEKLDGQWKLIITDTPGKVTNRSGTRGRALDRTQGEMIDVGSWQLDTAGADCGKTSAPGTVLPEAWFGTGEALYLNPAGGTLDGSASMSPVGAAITKYQWDLDGNGTFETETTTPTTPYPATPPDTTHTIGLRVFDGTNWSDPVTRSVVFTAPPSISDIVFSGDKLPPSAGDKVTVTGSATDDTSTATELKFDWDFNDDGVFGDKSGAEIKDYVWDTSGPKVVRLRVTDKSGATAYFNKTIKVTNQPPVAVGKLTSAPAIVGAEATFSSAGSSDPDGTVVKYTWNFGDGTASVDATAQTVKHTFTHAGTYTVTLVAIDNTGGVSPTLSFEVKATALPQGVITASPDTPLVGETVSFSAAGSADGDADGSITKYEWDLNGDGVYEVSGATAVSASKSYPNAGAISVRLRLTDNDGATAVTTKTLLVRNNGVSTTPTPTPKPGGNTGGNTGGGNGPVVSPPGVNRNPDGTGAKVDGVGTVPTVQDASTLTDPFDPDNADLTPGGILDNGNSAKLGAGSKQKGKKVYKKGVPVVLASNAKNTLVVKAMITVKDAKVLKLKIKKPTAIGSGKLILKKAGKAKFVVKFAKKYQGYVKRAKKTPVTLAGVVTFADGSTMAIARKVVIVK